MSDARARYVVLATAALEQKDAPEVAPSSAPAEAFAAAQPSSASFESNPAAAAPAPASEAAPDVIDSELTSEAAQLRRKRLEVTRVLC